MSPFPLDFLSRLGELCQEGFLAVYAWSLMENHFHLLVRTKHQPLSKSMRSILTGYVINFNRRHKRYGHLFQNRYKSIVCEDDPYLLELTRYIHLNPLRAGVVRDMGALLGYPWSGHSVLMDKERYLGGGGCFASWRWARGNIRVRRWRDSWG